MTIATKTITLLDPTSKPRSKKLKMAIRPSNLEGKGMGLLWNNKAGGDILLNRLAQLLNERFHFSEILNYKKLNASAGFDEDKLNDLSTKCDFVVLSTGDCGSCTSYLIYDAIELEKRGTPVIAICTREFASLGRAEAQALGMPNLAIVTVPHPVGGIEPEKVAPKADNALEDVIEALSTSREKLPERTSQQSEAGV